MVWVQSRSRVRISSMVRNRCKARFRNRCRVKGMRRGGRVAFMGRVYGKLG